MAKALEEEKRLRAFVAGFVYDPSAAFEKTSLLLDRVTGTRLTKLLRRRIVAEVGKERCHRTIAAEIEFFFRQHLPLNSWRSVRNVQKRCRAIDRFAATCVIDRGTKIVIGREDAALRSFRRTRELGGITVYDLPIAHYQTIERIMRREEAEFPGACRLAETTTDFAPDRIEHKENELRLADYIIVGSNFVERSLLEAGFSPDSVIVLPYACEVSWRSASRPVRSNLHGQNLVLHVGSLSMRKGTHRLLRAWKRLNAHRTHRLRLIGKMHLSHRYLRDYRGHYEHVDWVPPEELRAHYSAADFFVLPAAAEGFAEVLLEALSYGLPIVASRNSGAEGFIEHQKHGLLHKFGDENELCEQLDWMLSHPRERDEMSRQAWLKAAEWTWHDYRAQFTKFIGSLERPT